MSLIYYFDIGNTKAKLWRCRDGVVEATTSILHRGLATTIIGELPDEFLPAPQLLCGASVIGREFSEQFALLAMDKWACMPVFARAGQEFAGMTNGYAAPETLGADRWLGLIGALQRGQDFCVIGCGTALTLDIVKGRCHLGGLIVPGLTLVASALVAGTAGVRYELGAAEALTLGKSTAEAVSHGAMAAVTALIERERQKFPDGELILTGGDAKRVSAHLAIPHIVVPELLLHGLQQYFADPDISN